MKPVSQYNRIATKYKHSQVSVKYDAVRDHAVFRWNSINIEFDETHKLDAILVPYDK